MTAGEWTGIIGAFVALLVSVFGFVRGLRADRTLEKKASIEQQQAAFGANLELNKYIDSRVEHLVDERIGDVKRELDEERTARKVQSNAFIRILRTIARQWPPDNPGPVLDPEDIAVVEDSIPVQWLRAPERP